MFFSLCMDTQLFCPLFHSGFRMTSCRGKFHVNTMFVEAELRDSVWMSSGLSLAFRF